MIVAEIMEDGAEPCAAAATFISEILPMMGAVTEPSSSRYKTKFWVIVIMTRYGLFVLCWLCVIQALGIRI